MLPYKYFGGTKERVDQLTTYTLRPDQHSDAYGHTPRDPDTDADGEIDRASELGLAADKTCNFS